MEAVSVSKNLLLFDKMWKFRSIYLRKVVTEPNKHKVLSRSAFAVHYMDPIWASAIPRLALVAVFPRLALVAVFSRLALIAVFPRLALVAVFSRLALVTVFPRLVLIAVFPRLALVAVASNKNKPRYLY